MKSQKKYALASDVRLPALSELNFANCQTCSEIKALQKENLFVMECGHDAYLINPTIRSFLSYFHNAHTLKEAITHFAQKAKCDQKLIEAAITDFFHGMRRKGILCSEDRAAEKQTPSSTRFEKDQLIFHYQIESKIFNNKKIEIYKALDLNRNTLVAIKILKADQLKKKKRIKSFAQEFHILKDLKQHPNICQLINYVEEDEMVFGVLEYIEGLPMRRFIKRNSLSFNDKLIILHQFLKGMAHVHQQLIVHGDLHMSNLLVKSDLSLKIIDFNMSNRKILQAEEIIREGGVHQYIPPEKIDARGFKMVNGPANFISEVFQMGVIAYFLLYEQMPFKGFSWKSLANDIQNHEPTFYESTPKGEMINQLLLDLLKQMLHKKPKHRFKSAIPILRKYENILKIRKHVHNASNRSATA